VRMGGGQSGVAVANWIRQNHPGVPVLLASGHARLHETRDLPADIPVLRKPYILSDVLQRIQDLLRATGTGTS
jgi:DNA-binding response OmpR family regulator